ncbi:MULTISPECIES: hypothetical protein [unclassified Microcoleus]|uniref:hypothetical protein n=1 Tax=unclassified Microcoleus TaxID=2642155 RepID=UPI002FD084B0
MIHPRQQTTVNCQLSTVNCQLPTDYCQLPTATGQLSSGQLSTNLDVQVEEVEFGAVGFDEFAAGGDSIAH